MNPKKDTVTENATEVFEQMISFYSNLGFVPKTKYDEVVKENDFLKNTMKEMNQKVFTEGSSKIQDTWKETIDKQMEMNKEIAKNFLDLFKQKGEK
jgi:hypothetical protein